MSHIGRTELKTTMMGKLYLKKADENSGIEIQTIKTNLNNSQAKLDEFLEKEEEVKSETSG